MESSRFVSLSFPCVYVRSEFLFGVGGVLSVWFHCESKMTRHLPPCAPQHVLGELAASSHRVGRTGRVDQHCSGGRRRGCLGLARGVLASPRRRCGTFVPHTPCLSCVGALAQLKSWTPRLNITVAYEDWREWRSRMLAVV